jgi:pSer/pThr/pTyr-binding forkhead associated (FHA) protein
MSQPKEPEATRLESSEEIMKALAARKARRQASTHAKPAAAAAPLVAAAPAAPAARAVSEARRECPTQRPPMALLCIVDDGKQDGEWLRLRADRTVIGRSEGDVRIPHDVQMSTRHAEIVREQLPTGWRWLLQDAGSTNGTFVRVGNTILRNLSELHIGQGRYRFESATAAPNPAPASVVTAGTQMPQPAPVRSLAPSLVEITTAGPVQRFPLTLPEYWLGRDPMQAAIVRPDDPFVEGRHARFFRDKSGQWYVANQDSINGLWLRIKTIVLEKTCQFRLGEQRFIFRVCEP